jgi:plastocyanin
MKRIYTVVALAVISLPASAFGGGTISGTVTSTPTKYLQDTVVFLKSVPGAPAPRSLVIDQRGMKFVPRITLASVGDTVQFKNNDTVGHNVMSPDHGGYNLGLMKGGETKAHQFTEPGQWVQLCSVHPEMLAYVFVGQNPYAAVVDPGGKYTIEGVPPGSYELSVWNPKLKGAAQNVMVAEGSAVAASFELKR